MDSGDFEGSNSREDIVVWLIGVVIGNELAVDIFLMPGFGHFIHQTLCAWDFRLDLPTCVIEELLVLAFIVSCVPCMALAPATHLKNENRAVINHLSFFVKYLYAFIYI